MKLPFVLGTDLVHLTRWDPTADLSRVIKLASRILHHHEFEDLQKYRPQLYDIIKSGHKQRSCELIKQCRASSNDAVWGRPHEVLSLTPSTAVKLRNFLGGRWAAKEAAKKAWGAGLIGWKDIRVVYDNDMRDGLRDHYGSPGVKVLCQSSIGSDKVSMFSEQSCPSQEGRLSISHDGEYVVATVIAEPLQDDLRQIFYDRAQQASVRQQDRAPPARDNLHKEKEELNARTKG